jgi:hypothetical protein
MSHQKFDDTPFPIVCPDRNHGADPVVLCEDDSPDLEPEPSDHYETELDRRKANLDDLDRVFCATLSRIIKSGKATPGQMMVAVKYLKDKGCTLPEMARRERGKEHSELLEGIDLPFGNA